MGCGRCNNVSDEAQSAPWIVLPEPGEHTASGQQGALYLMWTNVGTGNTVNALLLQLEQSNGVLLITMKAARGALIRSTDGR